MKHLLLRPSLLFTLRRHAQTSATASRFKWKRYLFLVASTGVAVESAYFYAWLYPSSDVRKYTDIFVPTGIANWHWHLFDENIAPVMKFLGYPLPPVSTIDRGSVIIDDGVTMKVLRQSPSLNEVTAEMERVEKQVNTVESIVSQTQRSSERHEAAISTAMDANPNNVDLEHLWDKTLDAYEVYQQCRKEAISLIDKTKSTIDSLTLSDIEQKFSTHIEALKNRIHECEMALKKLDAERHIWDNLDNRIKAARERVQQQFKSVMSTAAKGATSATDVNEKMLFYMQQRVEQLQQHLASRSTKEELRVQQAVEDQRQLCEQRVQTAVNDALKDADRVHIETLKKREIELQAAFAQELSAALADHSSRHGDHLTAMLKLQRDELMSQFSKDLREEVLHEKMVWKEEIKGWIARMRGIEKALDDRADLERIAQKAQELWLASQALVAKLRGDLSQQGQAGSALSPWMSLPLTAEPAVLVNVRSNLLAIREAGFGDPFVAQVLHYVPSDVMQGEQVICTERTLINRFKKMKRVCKRVAQVEERGSSLLGWLLSHVQSWFVVDNSFVLRDDVVNERVENYALLATAEHCLLEKNDWLTCLRLVGALHGASAVFAADWLRDARRYLEVRQIADDLMQHASASGLGTILWPTEAAAAPQGQAARKAP